MAEIGGIDNSETRAGWTAAAEQRRTLGLSADGRLDYLADALGPTGVLIALRPMGAQGPDGVFGRENGRSLLGVNSNKTEGRQRLAIAHMFGHHVFASPGGVLIERDVLEGEGPGEERARAFAAAFLIPLTGLESYAAERSTQTDIEAAEVSVLSERFGVDYEATLLHLMALGLVDSQKLAKLPLREQAAWLLPSTVVPPGGGELLLSTDYRDRARAAFARGFVTMSQAAWLVREDEAAVTSTEPASPPRPTPRPPAAPPRPRVEPAPAPPPVPAAPPPRAPEVGPPPSPPPAPPVPEVVPAPTAVADEAQAEQQAIADSSPPPLQPRLLEEPSTPVTPPAVAVSPRFAREAVPPAEAAAPEPPAVPAPTLPGDREAPPEPEAAPSPEAAVRSEPATGAVERPSPAIPRGAEAPVEPRPAPPFPRPPREELPRPRRTERTAPAPEAPAQPPAVPVAADEDLTARLRAAIQGPSAEPPVRVSLSVDPADQSPVTPTTGLADDEVWEREPGEGRRRHMAVPPEARTGLRPKWRELGVGALLGVLLLVVIGVASTCVLPPIPAAGG